MTWRTFSAISTSSSSWPSPPAVRTPRWRRWLPGLPVVATDVGGMAEQVDDGRDRPARRDVMMSRDLAAALDRGGRRSRSSREAWGEAGKRRAAERFGDRTHDRRVLPGVSGWEQSTGRPKLLRPPLDRETARRTATVNFANE